jgi:hypothetical protein
MKRIVVAVALLAACVLGPSVQAHHSFAASYLENEWVTIEGQLVQFQLRNPHSFVQMVVREPDGRDVRYSVEWRGAGELVAQGVTNGTLRIGDHLVITGNPSRSATDHRVRLLRLIRPRDGFAWVWPSK